MLVLVVDNERSNSSYASDVAVLDSSQLPAAISFNPRFEQWLRVAGAGDVYQVGNCYRVVKLGIVTQSGK